MNPFGRFYLKNSLAKIAIFKRKSNIELNWRNRFLRWFNNLQLFLKILIGVYLIAVESNKKIARKGFKFAEVENSNYHDWAA